MTRVRARSQAIENRSRIARSSYKSFPPATGLRPGGEAAIVRPFGLPSRVAIPHGSVRPARHSKRRLHLTLRRSAPASALTPPLSPPPVWFQSFLANPTIRPLQDRAATPENRRRQ